MDIEKLKFVVDYVFDHYIDSDLDDDHKNEVQQAYEKVNDLLVAAGKKEKLMNTAIEDLKQIGDDRL